MLTFDHIAIACTDLAEGVAWVEARLGVALGQGGRHPRYGTHNRLLRMGDLYLEVIAPEPGAVSDEPRWFGLDQFSGPPRLANWICRTTDMTAAPAMCGPAVEMVRGDLTWQITVPEDGSLPLSGAYPTLLQWGAGVVPPGESLPDSGLRLTRWEVHHPMADVLAGDVPLEDPRVVFLPGAPGFRAGIATPGGTVWLE